MERLGLGDRAQLIIAEMSTPPRSVESRDQLKRNYMIYRGGSMVPLVGHCKLDAPKSSG